MHRFQVGDSAWLITDREAPEMVVTGVNGDRITCFWLDHTSSPHEVTLPAECLLPAATDDDHDMSGNDLTNKGDTAAENYQAFTEPQKKEEEFGS